MILAGTLPILIKIVYTASIANHDITAAEFSDQFCRLIWTKTKRKIIELFTGWTNTYGNLHKRVSSSLLEWILVVVFVLDWMRSLIFHYDHIESIQRFRFLSSVEWSRLNHIGDQLLSIHRINVSIPHKSHPIEDVVDHELEIPKMNWLSTFSDKFWSKRSLPPIHRWLPSKWYRVWLYFLAFVFVHFGYIESDRTPQ